MEKDVCTLHQFLITKMHANTCSWLDCIPGTAPTAFPLLCLCAVVVLQVAAPRLLDALAVDMPEELQQLRQVFLTFATFGAPRSGGPALTELDGVSALVMRTEQLAVHAGFAHAPDAAAAVRVSLWSQQQTAFG